MSITINRVYTRFGDNGQTRLASGMRVSKSHPYISALGELDELNSLLGLVLLELGDSCAALRHILLEIQQQLFDLGSRLSNYPAPSTEKNAGDLVNWLEKSCEEFNADLPELHSFILPGGPAGSAWLHLARAGARRAERSLVAALETVEKETGSIGQSGGEIAYLNRLGDFLFIAARWAMNAQGVEPSLWELKRTMPE